ncbi:MAG: GGDEF domain-containing protein [Firmicutes bacterium]|nr:GGDEF domain-containing protein [Bacillota bacterium]
MTNAIETYSISFLILLIILISIRRHSEKSHFENLLFTGIILINMTLLIFDFIQLCVDKQSGTMMVFLNNFSSFMFYWIAPFLTLLWLDYVDYFIHKDKLRIRKFHKFLAVPMLLYVLLCFLSMFTNIFFYVDSSNTYSRGNFYLLYLIIMYSFVVLSTYYIIKYRKRFSKSTYYPLLLFAVPPAIGGIIQAFSYGLLLAWPMTMISVFMVFVFVQSKRANTDYLTDIFNKREFDNYINVISKSRKHNYYLAGIFADLDGFKMINDKYGHYIGDLVLKETSFLLKQSFGPEHFIARLGGDEFGVIFKLEKPELLNVLIQKLNDNFADFNENKKFPFEIKLSIGSQVYDEAIHGSVQDFVKILDELMYAEKQ